MSNRSSPEGKKKMSSENDLNGAGAESVPEEESCLSGRARGTRLHAVRAQLLADTKLSPAARVVVIVLVLLCVVLLIVVIAMAICWPKSVAENKRCTTPSCLQLAAKTMKVMDSSGDRCQQPREWACGGWLQKNTARLPGRTSWSMHDDIRLQELTKLRDIITTTTSGGSPSSLSWKMKALYESCVSVDSIEADGELPLTKIINSLGGWQVLRSWDKLSWSWSDTLERLLVVHGVHPLLSVGVTTRNGRSYIHVKPDGLGLPHLRYYDEKDNEAIQAYRQLLQDTVMLLGAQRADAVAFAGDIIGFEQRIASIMMEYDSEEKIMTLQEFSINSQFLPLQDILRALYPHLPLDDTTEMLVTSPRYIGHLSAINTSTDLRVLNDYFIWTLTRQYLPYMSNASRVIWNEYQSHIAGAVDPVPRWEFCTDMIVKMVPLATTALLQKGDSTTAHDQNKTDAIVVDIFDNIKETALKYLRRSRNIDHNERETIMTQVESLNIEIGLNQNELDDVFLQKYHTSFLVQKHNLIQNVGAGLEFTLKINQESLASNDSNIVRVRAKALSSFKASYNHELQRIFVPRVLVSPPYFSNEYPRCVQFARIGAALAEGVMRAVVTLDSKHGSTLPPHAASSVACLTSVLSTDASEAIESYIRLGAIELAYSACNHSFDNPDDWRDPGLPALEQLTTNQLFILTYAQTLCSVSSKQKLLFDKYNSQIDGETMFNSIWPQMKSFAEALQCDNKAQCSSFN